ncbi:BA14K family protein [Rhizobium sp. BK418]|uniref:BA14K family protein n=1 Tax=Rhizobium sp. BK418 TaxID=2512120 RepID=UPI0010475403|nr:BA14K family protein [Rhizobium sp. BK418]TCR96290.1 BA14K-like protein [Rhizobium sp. BK418]
MKAIASLAFGIASSIGLCVAAGSVASVVLADPGPHTFESLSRPDIWTTKPVRVDVASQHYERIPAVYSSYVTDAPKLAVASRAEAPAPHELEATPIATMSPEHVDWCSNHYRSFDPATNSYRAYSGQTKTCTSPYSAPLRTAGASPQQHESGPADSAAKAWCAARYQSYRAEDNSYQPFDGPRRACVAPTRQVVASATGSGPRAENTFVSN